MRNIIFSPFLLPSSFFLLRSIQRWSQFLHIVDLVVVDVVDGGGAPSLLYFAVWKKKKTGKKRVAIANFNFVSKRFQYIVGKNSCDLLLLALCTDAFLFKLDLVHGVCLLLGNFFFEISSKKELVRLIVFKSANI